MQASCKAACGSTFNTCSDGVWYCCATKDGDQVGSLSLLSSLKHVSPLYPVQFGQPSALTHMLLFLIPTAALQRNPHLQHKPPSRVLRLSKAPASGTIALCRLPCAPPRLSQGQGWVDRRRLQLPRVHRCVWAICRRGRHAL